MAINENVDSEIFTQAQNDMSTLIADDVQANFNNLKAKANDLITFLRKFQKEQILEEDDKQLTEYQQLSKHAMNSMQNIMSSQKPLNQKEIEEYKKYIINKNTDIQQIQKVHQNRIDLIERLIKFQSALNKYLNKNISLTWGEATTEKNKTIPEFYVFNEEEEFEILLRSSWQKKGSRFSFSIAQIKQIISGKKEAQNENVKNTETTLVDQIKHLAKEQDSVIIDAHIEMLQNLYQYILDNNRVTTLKESSTRYLYLYWIKNQKERTYAYVSSWGVINEGYAGALMNYKDTFKNNNENNIEHLYFNYISNVDNAPGLFSGDVQALDSNQLNQSMENAIKSGRASSQSYKALIDFASWLMTISYDEIKENIQDAYYKAINKQPAIVKLANTINEKQIAVLLDNLNKKIPNAKITNQTSNVVTISIE